MSYVFSPVMAFVRVLRRDNGATAVEYGLMIALIAVAISVSASLLGERLAGGFEDVNHRITSTGVQNGGNGSNNNGQGGGCGNGVGGGQVGGCASN